MNDFFSFERMHFADINHRLSIACFNGNLPLVQEIFSSNKNNLSYFLLNSAFCTACYAGHLNIVKYFVSSDLFDIDIHNQKDLPFQYACLKEQEEVLKYLIFEQKIRKTENIIQYLEKNPSPLAQSLFLFSEMSFNVQPKSVKEKINKV